MNVSLMLLIDGRFPAGGHTNSAGVESAVRLGDITDEASLERYLHGRLATTGRVDAAFAARMAAATSLETASIETASIETASLETVPLGTASAETVPLDLIRELDAELSARILSPRLRSSSRRLGRQLLRAGSRVWPSETLLELRQFPSGPHQALVLGAVVASAGGGAEDAAAITLHHLSSSVATAAVRLLGLDPLNIAAIQAGATPLIERLVREAQEWSTMAPFELPADGGSLTEILAEDHGGWDARLFVA